MILGDCHVGIHGPGWRASAAWPNAGLPAPTSWGQALRAFMPFWQLENRADARRTINMNKCALDCSPPLRHMEGNASSQGVGRFTIHQIAAYHAGRGESAAFVIMLGTCCYSSHRGCEGMNQRLRADHAALNKSGHRVAPLLQYADVVRRPLITAERLLEFAPQLESLNVDEPRLREAAMLAKKTLALTSSGRHDGLVDYLASHNFSLTPKYT